jgi:nanoRNase/pAp phosphatase (c-di-AMP/oligoRNAs hydrolase)
MQIRIQDLDKVIRILATPNQKKIVLLHHNADPDSIGSAAALKIVFPNLEIGVTGDVSRTGQRLLTSLKVSVVTKPDLTAYNQVILVDTASASQLGPYADRLDAPIVLDHHAPSPLWDHAKFYYCDETKSSCTEIIYDVIRIAHHLGFIDFSFDSGGSVNIEDLERVGLALLVGIVSDSGNFRYATPFTFQTFSNLLRQTGHQMDEILDIVESVPTEDPSRKVAHLKAAQRVKYERVGEEAVLVAHSIVSSFEASAAKALLDLGADVALVAAQRGDEVRLSARARHHAVIAYDLHLGRLLHEVAATFNVGAGGHDAAAGLNGPGSAQVILDECLRVITERITGTSRTNGAKETAPAV